MTSRLESTELRPLAKCVSLALSRHDDAYVYTLPFPRGKRFAVMQGYGGAWSHTGEWYYSIDFALPEGTCVCASRGGVVVRAVDCYDEGGVDPTFKAKWNFLEIAHADRSVAVYGHLAHRGIHVSLGASVQAGEPIAVSGNTGWSSSPHLHFHVVDSASPNRVPVRFATSRSEGEVLLQGQSYCRPNSRPMLSNTSPAPEFFQFASTIARSIWAPLKRRVAPEPMAWIAAQRARLST
jgi:murein DD-endopeptidase MepM/ murein hydrolase activator NlpD